MSLTDLTDSLVYPRISKTWDRGDCATFLVTGSPQQFRVPLAFFAGSKRNTLAFAEEIILMLVNEPGNLFGEGGERLDLTQAPQNAIYVLIPVDGPFTWYKGPQGRNGAKAAPVEDNESLSSVSATQSEAQGGLMNRCIARDFGCLVTGADLEQCDAAHFVPKSRPDVYAELLAPDYAPDDLYHVSSAGLLAVELHRAYDGMKWSFFCDDGEMIVHVFSPDIAYRNYHGHILPPETFRLRRDSSGKYKESDLPDTRLCNWHYRQAVVRNIRGFSFGFSLREKKRGKKKGGQVGDEEAELGSGKERLGGEGDG